MKTQRKVQAPAHGYSMTLKEVAAEMGCTPERVRQIEKRALEKLGRILASRGVSPYLILPENFDEARA